MTITNNLEIINKHQLPGDVLQWCHNECDGLKSLASSLFAQLFVQAEIEENIKAPYHWPLWGESIGDWLIPLIKGQ